MTSNVQALAQQMAAEQSQYALHGAADCHYLLPLPMLPLPVPIAIAIAYCHCQCLLSLPIAIASAIVIVYCGQDIAVACCYCYCSCLLLLWIMGKTHTMHNDGGISYCFVMNHQFIFLQPLNTTTDVSSAEV